MSHFLSLSFSSLLQVGDQLINTNKILYIQKLNLGKWLIVLDFKLNGSYTLEVSDEVISPLITEYKKHKDGNKK